MFQLVFLPVLVLAVVIHECAHGIVAKWCGDDTAHREGRITLNPIKHVDLIGTIVVPIVLAITNSGILFGWAKPVPVNPNNFRSYRRDDIYVSMAGPASNLILAIVSGILLVVVAFVVRAFDPGEDVRVFMRTLLENSIKINLILALFNLFPIPPLDGSHVVASLLPPHLGEQYRSLGFMGLFILVAMMSLGIIGAVIDPIFAFLYQKIWFMINSLLA